MAHYPRIVNGVWADGVAGFTQYCKAASAPTRHEFAEGALMPKATEIDNACLRSCLLLPFQPAP